MLVVAVALVASAPAPCTVPPDQLNAPLKVNPATSFSVPPVTCQTGPAAACVTGVFTFTVAPDTSSVPVPENAIPALKLCVPPFRSSIVRLAIAYSPVSVPFALSRSVPLFTFTVPLLANRLSRVIVALEPAFLLSVPALVSVCGAPLNVIASLRVLVRLITPPSWLFNTAPPLSTSRSPPGPIVSVPVLFHVLPLSVGLVVVTLVAPLVLNSPAPCTVPPDQLNAPLIVSAPLPVKVPLANVNVPPVVEASDTVSVPPPIEMISVDCSLPVNWVPVLTVIVGLNAPRSMMTICPATGSPALQFAGTLQSAVVSLSQTLTPVNVVPRCRNTVLLTVCAT